MLWLEIPVKGFAEALRGFPDTDHDPNSTQCTIALVLKLINLGDLFRGISSQKHITDGFYEP